MSPEQDPQVPPLGPVFDFLRVLWALDHELQRASRGLAAAAGITGPQRLVLRIVERFPGILPGQLAAILHLHPSTLTGIVQRLVGQDLVSRRIDPRDRRRAQLGLTPKGLRALADAPGIIEEAVTAALAELDTRQLRATTAVLAALTARVAEGSGPKAPRRKRRRRKK